MDVPVLDRKIHADLITIIGGDQMRRLLEHLLEMLQPGRYALIADDDREKLAREAHTLISASGMLGFIELSEASRGLEDACQGLGNFEEALMRFYAARKRTWQHLMVLRTAYPTTAD